MRDIVVVRNQTTKYGTDPAEQTGADFMDDEYSEFNNEEYNKRLKEKKLEEEKAANKRRIMISENVQLLPTCSVHFEVLGIYIARVFVTISIALTPKRLLGYEYIFSEQWSFLEVSGLIDYTT